MKLSEEEVQEHLHTLGTEWIIVDDKMLQKQFHFDSFVLALAFVNSVGECAEKMQHHPDMHMKYSKVMIELSTHDEGGLTEKDFLLAREIDTCANG